MAEVPYILYCGIEVVQEDDRNSQSAFAFKPAAMLSYG